MNFVKFQLYIVGQGITPQLDVPLYRIAEGEGDHDVIKRLGYSVTDILFYEKTCQIIVHEINDHRNYDLSPRFVFEIEMPGHTDYILIRDIVAFLEFTREYLPSLEILNRNSKGNELP